MSTKSYASLWLRIIPRAFVPKDSFINPSSPQRRAALVAASSDEADPWSWCPSILVPCFILVRESCGLVAGFSAKLAALAVGTQCGALVGPVGPTEFGRDRQTEGEWRKRGAPFLAFDGFLLRRITAMS